jgi:hypothetical protein
LSASGQRTGRQVFDQRQAPPETSQSGRAECDSLSVNVATLEILRIPLYEIVSATRSAGQDCPYQAWLDALPESLQDRATAEALRAICDLDLSERESVEPPRGFGRD